MSDKNSAENPTQKIKASIQLKKKKIYIIGYVSTFLKFMLLSAQI